MSSGRFQDARSLGAHVKTDPYLAPFRHYIERPSMGTVRDDVLSGPPVAQQWPPREELEFARFPGFNPADMNQILRFADQGVDIARTTTLTVGSTRTSAGISNVPLSVREAEPVSMRSTFWIQELAEYHGDGSPRLRLQYSQVVMLDFFHPRQDELPGRAAWPHISIATVDKTPADYALKPAQRIARCWNPRHQHPAGAAVAFHPAQPQPGSTAVDPGSGVRAREPMVGHGQSIASVSSAAVTSSRPLRPVSSYDGSSPSRSCHTLTVRVEGSATTISSTPCAA